MLTLARPPVKDRSAHAHCQPFVSAYVPERFLGQMLGGRYRITRLLGAGAYAWVYEAVDVELEIPVAVKVLRPEHTGNEVSEARFRREATMAARLRHPNIVTVRDVGKGDGVTWVVMDLIPMSLARRLEVMPYLPETEVVRVGLDVASALAAAHAADIVHRDIKPDNILIGTTGESIVCDFGLARALTGGADLSATNQVLGTPHYFSPEQARGEALDGRSDLYALGITLYRAATGKLPFEGADWYAVARQHVDDAPRPPREHVASLSPAFEAIVLRLLAKKPADRFATATALADALSRLPTAPATGSRLALNPGGTTTTHTVSGRSGSWRNPIMIAGLLVVMVGGIGLMRSRQLAFAGSSAEQAADSVMPVPDSAQVAAADSTTAFDSLSERAPAVDIMNAAARSTPSPAVRRATLEITSSSDDAILYINGERAGLTPYRLTRAAIGRCVVRAVLPDGPGVFAGCPYNELTDTITLRAGATVSHSVNLARCTRVWLFVTPGDARISFIDTTGRVVLSGYSERISPAIIREGAWRVTGEAPRCAMYNDVDTLRAGADTLRFKLIC